MPKEPIKISELTPATSLLGFATLGYKMVDGEKTSVQLDLSHVQTAYENTVEATITQPRRPARLTRRRRMRTIR